MPRESTICSWLRAAKARKAFSPSTSASNSSARASMVWRRSSGRAFIIWSSVRPMFRLLPFVGQGVQVIIEAMIGTIDQGAVEAFLRRAAFVTGHEQDCRPFGIERTVRGLDERRSALLLQPGAAFRHDLRDGAGRWSAGDTFI